MSDTGGGSGWSPNPDKDQPSFSRYRRDREANPTRRAIVVVEDNIGDIFLVQETIAAHSLNADVYIITDGEQALGFFRQLDQETIRCPDILLLDLNIPKFDGFEILAHLGASEQCREMPTIVMTSSAAKTDMDRSASYNVNAYFNKPLTYTEFLALGDIIRRHL